VTALGLCFLAETQNKKQKGRFFLFFLQAAQMNDDFKHSNYWVKYSGRGIR
jgi:hypothetical protein